MLFKDEGPWILKTYNHHKIRTFFRFIHLQAKSLVDRDVMHPLAHPPMVAAARSYI